MRNFLLFVLVYGVAYLGAAFVSDDIRWYALMYNGNNDALNRVAFIIYYCIGGGGGGYIVTLLWGKGS